MGKIYRSNQHTYKKEATEEFLSILKVYRSTKNPAEYIRCFQQLQVLINHPNLQL